MSLALSLNNYTKLREYALHKKMTLSDVLREGLTRVLDEEGSPLHPERGCACNMHTECEICDIATRTPAEAEQIERRAHQLGVSVPGVLRLEGKT